MEYSQPNPLQGENNPTNYFIVADEAFPLKGYILKLYPHGGLSEEQQIYNYRISRARRVVENAFGILDNRFLVFLAHIHLEPPKVEKIVQAACDLHNFLCGKSVKLMKEN